jgi:hypothetical protein
MEMLQLYDDRRVCSLLDVATNLVGAVSGIWLGDRLRGLKKPNLAAGPALLLSCWAGALLFPFMPDFSRTHLWQKLAVFFFARPSFVVFVGNAAAWLAAARLMQFAGFPWLYALLPLRFFVAGLSLTWGDCAAAAVAWLLVRFTARDAVAAIAVLAAIVLAGLSPFHFSPAPQAFSWVPFRALLSADWESAFAILLRKSFLYGSAVWLLRRAGSPLWLASAVVASVLLGIEMAQRFLPNHVAESTDPLLALTMAWILNHLARNEKVPKRV